MSSSLLSQIIVIALMASIVSCAPVQEVNNTTVIEDQIYIDPALVITTTESTNDPVESFLNTSTFSCYGRQMGYYADIKLECRFYHFCTIMDNLGEAAYQRVSYLCLEETVFDQGDLNCVKPENLTVPCEKAEEHYDQSNKQFGAKEDSKPSMSDNLATNIMLNPLTRFITG